MRAMVGTALAVGMMLAAHAGWAGDVAQGAIMVEGAWARATPPNAAAGGAFMNIANAGQAADTLLGASSDVAGKVELHTHVKDGDIMRMAPVGKMDVAPSSVLRMAPGGLHIMLIGLKRPLKEGETFPLILDFAQAGKLAVTVDVKAMGAMGTTPMMHDPAKHEEHMKDPNHRAMHELMHGKQ